MRQFFLLDWVGKHKVAVLAGVSALLVLGILAGLFSSQLRTQVAPGESGEPEVLGSEEGKTKIETGVVLVKLGASQAGQVRQLVQNFEASQAANTNNGEVLSRTTELLLNTALAASAVPSLTSMVTANPTGQASIAPEATASGVPEAMTSLLDGVTAGPVREREVSDSAVLAGVVSAVPGLDGIEANIQSVELITKEMAGSDLQAIDKWMAVRVGESMNVPIRSEGELQANYADMFRGKGLEGILSPDYQYTEAERAALEKTMQALQALVPTTGGIENAELNFVAHVTMVPNDPYYHSSGSWGQSYDDLWGIKKIESAPAWDLSQGEGVTVAVIDTGVDYTHEDIDDNIWLNSGEMSPRVSWGTRRDKRQNGIDDDGNGYIDDWRGWDFANNDNDPMDGHGHGTHVAGTIAAEGNNGVGVIGVAPKVKVMAIKGLGDEGWGYQDELAEAVRYSGDMGAVINNNSWAGLGLSSVVEDAFQYVYDKNVVSIAAAGNSSINVKYFFPATFPTVIAVAATSTNDQRTGWSNYGEKVDVAAPGANVLSLRAGQTDMYGNGVHIVGQKYYVASGTSMAAPHAAGVAALVRAKYPEFNNEEIRNILKYDIDAISQEEDKPIGLGRLNAAKAVADDKPLPVAIISEPHDGKIVIGDDVEIVGTTNGVTFSHYIVEIAMGANATNWTTQNITLSSEGRSPVKNGVLARWDTRSLTSDYFSIRLTVYSIDGKRSVDVISSTTYLEKDIVEGWPINALQHPGDPSSPIIVIGNVDSDPEKEIVLKNGGYPTDGRYVFKHPNLSVFNHDGTRVAGWPREVDCSLYEGVPVLADVNEGGQDEIIFACGGDDRKIFIFDGDGQILTGWPKEIGSNELEEHVLAMPAVTDIDNDGIREIVVATGTYDDSNWQNANSKLFTFYAWHSNGESLAGWPVSYQSPIVFEHRLKYRLNEGLMVVDADGDGWKEMFLAINNFRIGSSIDNDSKVIFAFNHSGVVLPGWPREVPATKGYITIGDVAGSKDAEIIILTFRGEMYVLQLNGELISPWPIKAINIDTAWDQVTPILINLDSDEQKEISIYGLSFNGDGSIVSGWEGLYDFIDLPLGLDICSPEIMSDITGDGSNGVLLMEGCYGKFLEAISADGTNLKPGWPKLLDEQYVHPPGVAGGFQILTEDLDGDGKVEIINLREGRYYDYKIHVYKTPGLASAGTWPLMHKDAQHSRGYEPPPNQPPVVDAGNPSYTLQLPATLTLNGTATDDGLPNPPGQVTVEWKKVSGPGEVTFTPVNELTTSVTFSEGGEYVLELTASDSEKTHADQVSVSVQNPPVVPDYHWTFDNDISNKVTDTTGKYVGTKYYVDKALNNVDGNTYSLLFNKLSNAVVFNNNFIRGGPTTVSMWIKPTDWGKNGDGGRVVDNTLFVIYLSASDKTVHFILSGVDGKYIVKANSNAITLGQWHHVTVTLAYDGRARIYINGQQSGREQYAAWGRSLYDTLILGNNRARNKDYRGNLDDFRIYRRILTNAQIQELARTNKPFR